MRYWLTTKYPALEDETQPLRRLEVAVSEGHQAHGAALQPGHRVLIYQTKSGKDIVRDRLDGGTEIVRRKPGAGGVIGIVEVATPLRADDTRGPEHYTDNTTRHWRWRAAVNLVNLHGYVPKAIVCANLRTASGEPFSPNYSFRGFGPDGCGLKEISEDEFSGIVAEFVRNPPFDPTFHPPSADGPGLVRRFRRGGPGGTGESAAHRSLKESIAANPVGILGEVGLTHVRTEYPFPTGDRCDVVLRDGLGRLVAVEVELSQVAEDSVGMLQAIKYRHMIAALEGRLNAEVRAMLVAHSIDAQLKAYCAKYAVETIEVPRQVHVSVPADVAAAPTEAEST